MTPVSDIETRFKISPHLSEIRKGVQFVEEWSRKAGLSGKILSRFLFAVNELIEAIILISRQNEGRNDPIFIEAEPWEGWIKVTIRFSAEVAIEPCFEHTEGGNMNFPGKNIAAEVFWHRLVLEWVDKAEWSEIGQWKTVSFIQYARLSESPGELYFLSMVPVLKEGVNLKVVGNNIGIVTLSGVRNAFKLTEEMIFVLNVADGKRNVRDIYRLYVNKFGLVHPKVVGRIIEELIKKNLLLPGRSLIFEKKEKSSSILKKVLSEFLSFQYSIPKPDLFVSNVYRFFGWIWSPVVGITAIIFILLSWHILAVDFKIATSIAGRAYLLFTTKGGEIAFLSLFLLNIHIVFHELSHAVVCKRFGGRIPAIGILFYYGIICAFADTTESWAFPSRRERIMVSLAGPLSDLTVSCIYGWTHILLTRYGFEFYACICGIMSALLFYFSLVNMMPFLETDGYYILSDLLNMPNLRKNSWNYLKSLFLRLFSKKSANPQISIKEKIFYVIFGITSMLCVFLLLIPPILIVLGIEKAKSEIIWFICCFFVVIIVIRLSKAAFQWYHETLLAPIDLKKQRRL